MLPVFEGPLDLLLHLIEKEELDISEVSLVAVTDQYLQSLDQLEEIQPGALADFLVVASRLLYIKSTRLLPKPMANVDEDEEEGSDSLIRHLMEYRQFKRIAGDLRTREELGMRALGRTPGVIDFGAADARPVDLGDLELSSLQTALRTALQRMPVDAPPPKVHPYTVTVAEQIEIVRRTIAEHQAQVTGSQEQVQIRFSELLGGKASRLEVLVTFLAVLELIKQRELHAVQEATFGEIVLIAAADQAASDASPAVDGLEPDVDEADMNAPDEVSGGV
jgi:segregation and condensation protein A